MTSAANVVLLDTKDVTIWRDADGAFRISVGRPHDFRSAEVPRAVMLAFLRNLDELIGNRPPAHSDQRIGGRTSGVGDRDY